jgi:hypothetical protein
VLEHGSGIVVDRVAGEQCAAGRVHAGCRTRADVASRSGTPFARELPVAGDVFGLEAAGDISSWGHARAFLAAGAGSTSGAGSSSTSMSRPGVGGSASLRGVAVGSLEVGADGRAGAGIRAQLPLDLFGEFGLVVRGQAGARASAWARAEAGLTGEAMLALVGGRLQGPWRLLAEALLPQLAIRAGFVARASVAAEAHASLALAGTPASAGARAPATASWPSSASTTRSGCSTRPPSWSSASCATRWPGRPSRRRPCMPPSRSRPRW